RDLESLNGTLVNGVPTRQKALEHGDRIKIGGSQFIYLEQGDDSAVLVPLSDSFEGQFVTSITVKVDTEDSVFLQPDRGVRTLAPNARLARDLAAVLRISTAINAIRKAEELQSRVLEMIFEVMPVERGAILLTVDNSEEFVSGTYRERDSDSAEPFRISRTI